MIARSVPGGRSGPRASFACQSCRARKIKCDVQKTKDVFNTCSPCRAAKTQCSVNHNDLRHRRRQDNQQREVEVLSARIRALEAAMRRVEEASSPRAVEATERRSNGSQQTSSLTPASQPSRVSQIVNTSVTHVEHAPFQDFQNTLENPQLDYQDISPHSREITNATGAIPGDGAQYTSIQPYIAQDTEPTDAFYGPTAQQYTWSSSMTPTDDWMPLDNPDGSPALDTGSTQLRKLLLDESWKHYRLPASIVNRDLFEAHRNLGQRSHYYSDFLECALLACAARQSTSRAVRQCGHQFAQLAKASIATELEDPSCATVQGFVLLSDYVFTMGNSRLGWTYTGIAARLALDLGLFEDPTELVTQMKLSPLEGRVRQYLFLLAFVFDSLWSLYLGRPGTISRSDLDTRFHVARQNLVGNPMLDAWVNVCSIMAQVTEILNKSISLNAQDFDRLAQCDRELAAWYASLPPALRGDNGGFSELEPISFALNMQYSGLRIILHGHDDFTRRRSSQTHATEQHLLLPGYSKDRSKDIAYREATRIARLVGCYVQIYGVEKLSPVMLDNIVLASSVLVSHVGWFHNGEILPLQQAISCMRSLYDILDRAQKHYPVASIMKATLFQKVRDSSMTSVFRLEERSQSL